MSFDFLLTRTQDIMWGNAGPARAAMISREFESTWWWGWVWKIVLAKDSTWLPAWNPKPVQQSTWKCGPFPLDSLFSDGGDYRRSNHRHGAMTIVMEIIHLFVFLKRNGFWLTGKKRPPVSSVPFSFQWFRNLFIFFIFPDNKSCWLEILLISLGPFTVAVK